MTTAPKRAMARDLAGIPTSSGLAGRLALAELERRGIDAKPLLRHCGLTPVAFAQRRRVSAASQMEFLEMASDAAGDAWLGLSLADSFDLRELGMLYYVAASSHTLGEALRRIERYVRVGNEALVARLESGSWCCVSLSYAGVPRHKDKHQTEFLFVVLLRLCRQCVGQRIVPIGASFIHHRADDIAQIQRRLGCEVQFNAHADELRFDAAVLALPLIGDDRFLNELMVENCEEALKARSLRASAFCTTVQNAIAPLLPHGEARAKAIANSLGLSERTFARRLSAEGLTFAELLDQLRRELAVRYLKEPDLQVSQVAWLLGFHHPSAFSRACNRWFGKSPSAYRRSFDAIC